jgi:hypothetical protein
LIKVATTRLIKFKSDLLEADGRQFAVSDRNAETVYFLGWIDLSKAHFIKARGCPRGLEGLRVARASKRGVRRVADAGISPSRPAFRRGTGQNGNIRRMRVKYLSRINRFYFSQNHWLGHPSAPRPLQGARYGLVDQLTRVLATAFCANEYLDFEIKLWIVSLDTFKERLTVAMFAVRGWSG